MASKKKLKRSDYSLFNQWLWRTDTSLFFLFVALAIMGVILSLTASPPLAQKLGYEPFFFVYRQLIFASASVVVMSVISLLNTQQVRRLALFVFIVSTILLILLPIIGMEKKGATRWVIVPIINLSLQPSEFVKPSLVIVLATILAERYRNSEFRGFMIAGGLTFFIWLLIVLQPDISMSLVVLASCVTVIYLGGFPAKILLYMFGILAIPLASFLWFTQAHLRTRIMDFWETSIVGSSASDIPYQVRLSMKALSNGGTSGVGPGAGEAKLYLPDAHTDFIFAVIGEEFGIIPCLLIVFVFMFAVLKIFRHAFLQKNLFTMLALSGLGILLALQIFINLSTTLNIMPTTGMALPFISYGGSASLATAYLVGSALALIKERVWDSKDIYNETL